jgi:riboflavin kinase/FMN adenylyltransferase
MELIRGLYNLRPEHRECVATIGNYDGLHLGHQKVLAQLVACARQRDLPSLVMCFEPTPQEFFASGRAPARLSSLREKFAQFASQGVDRFLCMRFDRQLSAMSADDFVQFLLVDGIGVRQLIVGDDFRFGHHRSGDFSTLVKAGEKYGFEVTDTATFELDGSRVSSTRIRTALAAGDLAKAQRLLGRPYSIGGRVIRGRELGREIGYPTANVSLRGRCPPLRGVFAVRVEGLERTRAGVANLGTRPTVDGRELLLEVHLFNFSDEIYGRHIEVNFVERLRDEARFDNVVEMTRQLDRDAEQARRILAVTD